MQQRFWTLVVCALTAGSMALMAQAPPRPTPVVTDNSPGKGPLDRLAFRAIGPATPSGRVDDLAVLESDPSTFYVGMATSGVYKTTNGGGTWQRVEVNYPASSTQTSDQCALPTGTYFTGDSPTYAQYTADLSPWAGSSAMLRFELSTDVSVTDSGWWVDEIRVSSSGTCLTGTVGPAPAPDGSNGTTGEYDYVNLDAVVHDATELMDEWHRDDTDLVVIVGRDLVHQKYQNIINAAADTATEMLARDTILTLPKLIGGKKAVMVPFFPASSLLITSYDNLPIYVQNGTRRRALRDEVDYDQIANYESVNEAYVVEDYGRCSLVENIVMGKAPARAVAP